MSHPAGRRPVTEPQHFSVQACANQGSELVFSGCVHVEARSPVDAAERVLHEKLTLSGHPAHVRAKVWRLGEDYQPVSILLYRP